jgi:predicted nucleic acid-binding protein
LLVDASIALKWFLPPDREPGAAQARALIGNVPLLTPSLTAYEVGNVLTVRGGLPAQEVAAALAALRSICGEPEPLTPADETRAARLAQDHALTFYDAGYAAIAQRLARPLVSADAELLNAGLAIPLAEAVAR